MRATIAVVIIVLICVVAAVIYRTPRPKADVQLVTAPQIPANAPNPQREPGLSRGTLIDTNDPQFVERILPGVRRFFATLDRAGVNPVKGELPFNNIRIHESPHAMDCRFLIGDSWTATFLQTPQYSGVIHFGQRGRDNPFRAISHANTNALIRLSENAIKMSQAEAERIIGHISDVLGVDRSKFEKPEIHSERMFDYDLGMYTVGYRKKGSDPINQLNYTLNFSIKATSPTTAVMVMYSDSP